ncbi:MAG: hypothetical protein WKF70_14490 [Chitinophagaceae bacterium]
MLRAQAQVERGQLLYAVFVNKVDADNDPRRVFNEILLMNFAGKVPRCPHYEAAR